jgi:hypothetical protein
MEPSGEIDMHTDESETPSQPPESDKGRSQVGGVINGMLKGTVSNVGDNLRKIVHSEVELAKAELKQEASQIGRAGGMIAGSGVLGLAGFMFLMLGLTHLLGRKMPLWASASLVGSALIAIAGILGMSGKGQLQDADFTPERTIQSLKEVKDRLPGVGQS